MERQPHIIKEKTPFTRPALIYSTGLTAIKIFGKHRLPLLSLPGLSNSQNLGPHMPLSFKLSPLYFYPKKSRQIWLHNRKFDFFKKLCYNIYVKRK